MLHQPVDLLLVLLLQRFCFHYMFVMAKLHRDRASVHLQAVACLVLKSLDLWRVRDCLSMHSNA